MLAVATGATSCLGEPPQRCGLTCFGAHEGRHEIGSRRLPAWLSAHQIEGDHPHFLAKGPRLYLPGEADAFVDSLKRLQDSAKQALLAIGLDTLQKCMATMDVSKAQDMSSFIAFVDRLLEEFPGCSVLYTHHVNKPGKDGKIDWSGMGSGAIINGTGSVLGLQREGKARNLDLHILAHKDAPEAERPIPLDAVEHLGSLVLQLGTARPEREEETEQAMDAFVLPGLVGATLAALHATDVPTGVPTEELASHLAGDFPADQIKLELKRNRASAIGRKLGALSSKSLSAYAAKRDGKVIWYMPTR